MCCNSIEHIVRRRSHWIHCLYQQNMKKKKGDIVSKQTNAFQRMRSKHSGTNIVLTFQSVRWYPQVMVQHNGNRYNVCVVPFVDLIGPTWPPLPFLACRSMYESVIRHQSLYTFQLLPAHVVAQSMDLIYFICIYNNDIIKLIYMYNRNYYYNKMI